jgi:hypothetical protein
MHAGVKTTLSELKERFWIIKGRQQVKKSWFACVTCRKLSSPPFQELAAPLPLNRLKKAQAFNVTGVDFAGPLYCKKDPKKQDTDEDYMAEDGSHKLYKCYVCLFTCAVTRAIHLELVPDLSARSFLLAIDDPPVLHRSRLLTYWLQLPLARISWKWTRIGGSM